MTPKGFLTLAAVTGLAVIGAGAALVGQYRAYNVPRADDAPFFPNLLAERDAVARISIDSPLYNLVFEKNGENWVVANQGGYPTDNSMVNQVISGLANMRPFVSKTNNPELFPYIGLQDPTAEDSDATLVTVEGAGGEQMGSLVLGNPSNSIGYNILGGSFVRLPDSDQAWLAEGRINLPPIFMDWFKQIVHVSGPDIQSVAIDEGGQRVFEARKVDPTLGRYELVSINDPAAPTGDIIASDTNVKTLGQGIVSTTFDEARAEADIPFTDNDRKITFTTSKNLTLVVQVSAPQDGGAQWVRYTATAPADSEGAAQATQITERTQGFAFRLPAYRMTPLKMVVASLVEPKPAEGEQGQQLPPGMILPPEPAPTVPLFRLPTP